MKVLFLDHDGVICLERQWGTRYNKQDKLMNENKDWVRPPMSQIPIYSRFDDFDQDCIDVLNQVLLQTDCQIVVSSDWREWATVEEMGDYYESQGILRRPIGFTPTELPEGLKFYYRDSYREETRSYEILQWLSENPQVTHWAAIDDLDMRKNIKDKYEEWDRDWGLSNFVWTCGWGDFGIKEKGKFEELMGYLK
jgi:hypothetical protein